MIVLRFDFIGDKKCGSVPGLHYILENAVLRAFAAGTTNGVDTVVTTEQSTLIAATNTMKVYTFEDDAGADLVYASYADLVRDPFGSYGADKLALVRYVAQTYDLGCFWQQRILLGSKVSRVGA